MSKWSRRAGDGWGAEGGNAGKSPDDWGSEEKHRKRRDWSESASWQTSRDWGSRNRPKRERALTSRSKEIDGIEWIEETGQIDWHDVAPAPRHRRPWTVASTAVLLVIIVGSGVYGLRKSQRKKESARLEAQQHEAQLAWGQGNQALEQRRAEDAITEYTQAIALWPRFVAAYVSRGNAEVSLMAYGQAMADYDAAINLNSSYPEAYLSRGTAHWLLGELEPAATDFGALVSLRPDDEFFAGRYAQVLYEQGKKRGAEDFYHGVYDHNHADWALLGWIEGVSANRGDQQVIEECKRLNPHNTTVALVLGTAYFKLDRYEDAISYLKRATEGDPAKVPLDVFDLLAKAYLKVGDKTNALRAQLEFNKRNGREDEFRNEFKKQTGHDVEEFLK